MKITFATVALWLSCVCSGAVIILAIHAKRQESRVQEIEFATFKLENKLYRLQHPIKIEIEPMTGRPFRDYQEHTTK